MQKINFCKDFSMYLLLATEFLGGPVPSDPVPKVWVCKAMSA